MPDGGQLEQRLVAWDSIPDGSMLRIQVEPGDYVVTGRGKLRSASGGATVLDLGFHELVERPFAVPIARGADFRLTITLTYVRATTTRGRIRAEVRTPAGGTHQSDFECTYEGSLGSTSPEDELIIIAVGEP